jgi:hypothetical protein
MRKILTIRHWQLVTIIVVPAILFSTTPFKEIVGAICGLLFLLWIYSIGYFGQKQIKSIGLRPENLRLFNVNVLLLPILIILSRLPIFAVETSITLDLIEMILGFYSAFAAFQVLLFAGKTLAELEYRRQVSFSEYFMNSLQIIVFILGVWTIQPKINRQFKEVL